jgi:hypothetical protein
MGSLQCRVLSRILLVVVVVMFIIVRKLEIVLVFKQRTLRSCRRLVLVDCSFHAYSYISNGPVILRSFFDRSRERTATKLQSLVLTVRYCSAENC